MIVTGDIGLGHFGSHLLKGGGYKKLNKNIMNRNISSLSLNKYNQIKMIYE